MSDPISRDEFNKLYDKVDDLDDKLGKIEKALTRYTGFVGGVLFVASVISWAFVLAWNWFIKT